MHGPRRWRDFGYLSVRLDPAVCLADFSCQVAPKGRERLRLVDMMAVQNLRVFVSARAVVICHVRISLIWHLSQGEIHIVVVLLCGSLGTRMHAMHLVQLESPVAIGVVFRVLVLGALGCGLSARYSLGCFGSLACGSLGSAVPRRPAHHLMEVS